MLIRDVLETIFFNLPVESLTQCCRVCQEWRSIILTRHFIKTHMEKGPNSHRKLFFFLPYDRESWDPYSVSYDFLDSEQFKQLYPSWNDMQYHPSLRLDDQDLTEFVRLDPLFEPLDKFEIVGSCNGLVCFADGNRVLLWNPVLGQSLLLPLTVPDRFHVSLNSIGCRNFFAFGFDLTNQDYKVLRIVTGYENLSREIRTELYSLNDRSWKDISYYSPDYCLKEYMHYGSRIKRSVSVNGAFHWIVMHDERNVVAALDLANEVFREILLPDCLAKLKVSIFSLAVIPFGSSLAVSRRVTGSFVEYDIWVMRTCEEHSSWYKLGTFGQGHAISLEERMMKMLVLRNNGHGVIQYFRGWLGSQDPELNIFQRFNIDENVWANVCSYVESLVPLNKRDCAEVARSVKGEGHTIKNK